MILRRGSKAKATLKMDKLECEGVATVNRDQWKTEVENSARINMKMAAEVDVLRSLQESSGEFPPEILVEDLVQEVAAPR